MLEPAKSAEPPIRFGNFDTISKKISEDFLVAIGFEFFKLSFFIFSIERLNDLIIFLLIQEKLSEYLEKNPL